MRLMRPAVWLFATVLATQLGGAVVGDARAACLPSDLEEYEWAMDGIAASCDCASAVSRKSHAACVRSAIGERVAAGWLRPGCATQLRRCNRKSVCGRAAGAVRCCMPVEPWPKCRITRSAERCREIGGTPSSSTGTSCCEACAPADPCRFNDFPACGGACPRGRVCQAVEITGDTQRAFCVCADASDTCPSFDPRCTGTGAPDEVLDCSCPPGETHSFYSAGGGVECWCSGLLTGGG